MKRPSYIWPVMISTRIIAQQDREASPVEFGFNHGIYTSVASSPAMSPANALRREPAGKAPVSITQSTLGFQYGVFLWVKVSERISIRPELNACFSNYKFQNPAQRSRDVYATSTDLSVANQVIIHLKPVNTHGMIRAAKCMSYYLTAKQPYVLVGPKLGYKKFDRGFLHKGFENEASMGIVLGYGINYGFHNMNVAPEIKYSLETSAQNASYNRKTVIHTVTLSINLF